MDPGTAGTSEDKVLLPPARSEERAPRLWVHRALLMLVVSWTLGPLGLAGASVYSPHHVGWNGLFEFLFVSWGVEVMAVLVGAPLIWRLKDARKQDVTRTLRAELFVARLAFWTSLMLSLALPCAIALVWMMGIAMLS